MYEQLKLDIERLVQQGSFYDIRSKFDHLESSEVAALLEILSREDGARVFRLLRHQRATSIFKYLSHESQLALIESLHPDDDWLVSFLNDLSPDDRTAFFAELPDDVVQNFLSLLNPKERENAVRLLSYPEESIGRLATTDYIALRPHWAVEQALRQIRRFGRDSETINVIYIVDNDWKLLDDLRLREILLAEPDIEISSLMDNRFVAVSASDDQEAAVAVFRDNDRAALPVIDEEGVLVGIVTIDDMWLKKRLHKICIKLVVLRLSTYLIWQHHYLR